MFARIFHPKNLFNRPVAESTVKATHDLQAFEPETARPPAVTVTVPHPIAPSKEA